MKTYPYQTPEGIIELVEQHEYDEILKLSLQLANLRAEDIATIKELRETLESRTKKSVELEQALLLAGKLEQSANQQLQDAVKRMEAVPALELNKLHFDAFDYGNFNDIEAIRARLISAAKGEQL